LGGRVQRSKSIENKDELLVETEYVWMEFVWTIGEWQTRKFFIPSR
jgi:hypothetical protein